MLSLGFGWVSLRLMAVNQSAVINGGTPTKSLNWTGEKPLLHLRELDFHCSCTGPIWCCTGSESFEIMGHQQEGVNNQLENIHKWLMFRILIAFSAWNYSYMFTVH